LRHFREIRQMLKILRIKRAQTIVSLACDHQRWNGIALCDLDKQATSHDLTRTQNKRLRSQDQRERFRVEPKAIKSRDGLIVQSLYSEVYWVGLMVLTSIGERGTLWEISTCDSFASLRGFTDARWHFEDYVSPWSDCSTTGGIPVHWYWAMSNEDNPISRVLRRRLWLQRERHLHVWLSSTVPVCTSVYQSCLYQLCRSKPSSCSEVGRPGMHGEYFTSLA